MYDTFSDEGQESIADLLQYFDGLCLIEFFFFLKKPLKITITEFLNDVVVVWALHNVEESYNIFWLDSL